MADVLPNDVNRRGWRACLLCGLIKTKEQFRRSGCDNCEEVLELQGESQRVADCTSAQFDGIVGMTQPNESWVAKWQRCDKFTPGLYAIRVSGRLPDNIIDDLREKNFAYRPRDGSKNMERTDGEVRASVTLTMPASATEKGSAMQTLLARAATTQALRSAVFETHNEAMSRLLSTNHISNSGEKAADYYRKYCANYSNAKQPLFPRAYAALLHVPSLFDTLMDLERIYAIQIHTCLAETRQLRHERIDHTDEESMLFEATRESLLADLRSTQKQEYRDFVIQVHNELLLRGGGGDNGGNGGDGDGAQGNSVAASVPSSMDDEDSAAGLEISVKTHMQNAEALLSSLANLRDSDADRVLEGAVGKLKKSPSIALRRVGSVEAFLGGASGNSNASSSTHSLHASGTNTPISAWGNQMHPRGLVDRLEDVNVGRASTPTAPTTHPVNPSSYPSNHSNASFTQPSDPDLDLLVSEIKEMGFTETQAKAALDLSKRNLERALNLLLEEPTKVDKHARDTAIRGMLFPTASTTAAISLAAPKQQAPPRSESLAASSSHPELSARPERAGLRRVASGSKGPSPLKDAASDPAARVAGEDRIVGVGASIQQPFNPFVFLQTQQAKVAADLAALGGGAKSLLGKAMEVLHAPADIARAQNRNAARSVVPAPADELSESFTATLGTQVRGSYAVRVRVAASLFDAVAIGGGVEQDAALRAQTAAGIYGNALCGAVLLVRRGEVEAYAAGRGANQDFIRRAREATEFHFEDLDVQLRRAMDACPLNPETMERVWREGDFFVTRHSNLPQVHVLFHLIVGDEETPRELSSQSPLMMGYRAILKLAHLRDIRCLVVPVLFLPYGAELDFFENDAAVAKRAESVLKATKGLLIEQTRGAAGRRAGGEGRGWSLEFVVVRGGLDGYQVTEAFGAVCGKVGEVFRTS
ncbi:hypothetical protein BC830DRAFT_1167570 [Chytriomyces sp. MP71]|nr:hypothetical protein BC830DRAFT_1167570 [Chytriomyces sp. MP71]